MEKFEDIIEKLANGDTTLTNVNLSFTELSVSNASLLAKALADNTVLRRLFLSSVGLSADVLAPLAEALSINYTLTSLDLSFNHLEASSIAQVAKLLALTTTLESLNLRANNLQGEGAAHIATALSGNTSLTHLNLQETKLAGEGAKRIAEALLVNSTLTSLNLRMNELRMNGVARVAEALLINTALTSLNLSQNLLVNETLGFLVSALEYNPSITKLEVGQLNGDHLKRLIARNQHNTLRKTTSLFSLLVFWLPIAGSDEAYPSFAPSFGEPALGILSVQEWDAVWPSETPGRDDDDAANSDTDSDLFADGDTFEGMSFLDDDSLDFSQLDSALTRRLNHHATFYSEEDISSDEAVVEFPEGENYFDEQSSTDPQPAVAEDGAGSWDIANTGLENFNPSDGFAVGDTTEWVVGRSRPNDRYSD